MYIELAYGRKRFTFHHVSIKTPTRKRIGFLYVDSHSTMYLLKLELIINTNKYLPDSHSTMYLLKPYSCFFFSKSFLNSHSTMYLLKPFRQKIFLDDKNIFTFHHVSIKTLLDSEGESVKQNSHSTMYLLKRAFDLADAGTSMKFTFHHVSIKTVWNTARTYRENPIHIPPCIY